MRKLKFMTLAAGMLLAAMQPMVTLAQTPPTFTPVLTPSQGDINGGTLVTVAATRISDSTSYLFLPGTTVTIDGVSANSINVLSGILTFNTPPHAVGLATVLITNYPNNETGTATFTYTTPAPQTASAQGVVALSGTLAITATNVNFIAKILTGAADSTTGTNTVTITDTTGLGWHLQLTADQFNSGTNLLGAPNTSALTVQEQSNNLYIGVPLTSSGNQALISSSTAANPSPTFSYRLAIPAGTVAGTYTSTLTYTLTTGP